MCKAILMILLAIASGGLAAQIASPSVAPSYWKPWNEVHVYAPDLDWKSDKMPNAVFDALPEDDKGIDKDGEKYAVPGPYARIDLDGDRKDEVIVDSGQWYSGGREYVILQQRGNRWRVIGEFQGGFTVSKHSTKGYADIETWSRHPETYHHLWQFSGKRYKLVRREVGPRESRGFDIPFSPGVRLALTSQAAEFKKAHPCPQAGQFSKSCPGYVIVFVKPIERGGADSPSNMRWHKTH